MKNRVVTVVLAVFFVVSSPIGTVAAGTEPPPAASLEADRPAAVSEVSSAPDDGILHRTLVLSQRPDRPGEFETELTVSIPEAVGDLEVTLESAATVTETAGFDRLEENVYRWDGSTAEPTVTFTMPANRTGTERRRAAAGSEGYTFVETGSWGVVQVPDVVALEWRERERVGTDRTVVVDGPGATGGDVAFFGEATEYERTVDGERFRLVVPEAADLAERPDDILESLATASERLRIGAPNDEVFVVAAPTDGVEWGPRGIQYGDGDAWVRDDAPLDEPENVWIHEYVHTRQDFARGETGTTAETRWLVEGSAEYYAALATLEQDRIDYDEFRRFLEAGGRSPYADGTLDAPATWDHERTDYVRGALVLGTLDRELRLATDGERSLSAVVRELNLEDDALTQAAFLAALERAGGADVRALAERYTETNAVPETWSRLEHRTAFAGPIALFEYRIEDAAITGAYREAAFAETTTVVVGETVAFDVAVANVGDRVGSYDATLQADGRLLETRRGTLAAGDGRVERLAWTPEEPGLYDVTVGDRRLSVRVRSPAEATVTQLRLESATVEPGESVTATATVENDADRPGEATVRFRTPEGVADERTVTLAAGERTTVETSLAFDEAGRYQVAAGDRVAVVAVEDDLASRIESGAESVPGFGVPVALVAALAVAVAHGRRQ